MTRRNDQDDGHDNEPSPEEVARLLKEAADRRERRKPYMRAYMAKRRARLKQEAAQ